MNTDGPVNGELLLSEKDYEYFRLFILDAAGIDLGPNKRALVQSRLAGRVRAVGCKSFTEYWRKLQKDETKREREQAINLLSTNETYFFREPQHFDWLRTRAREVAAQRPNPLRVWSAACSTGEEPYTIAITLAEALGLAASWRVHATDINTHVTRYAKRGVYPLARVQKTPPYLWQKYFQHGRDEYEGRVRVKDSLQSRVDFGNINLLHSAKAREREFDVIFMRNVLIYFNDETKYHVIDQLCNKLVPGGYLLIGHAENLPQNRFPLAQEAPSRFRKLPAAVPSRALA
jgi:chemotaxis protein methyltransferase CheR